MTSARFAATTMSPAAISWRGVAALKIDLKHGFIDNAPVQLRDVQTIARGFQPDLLLGDPGFIGGVFLLS